MKMKSTILLTAIFIAAGFTANANIYRDMEPLKLEVPEMKAELVELPASVSCPPSWAMPFAT